MKKSLFLFAIMMLTFCVSAFSQNYDQKKIELLKLCKTKVLAENLDSYIRQSTASEIAVTVTNVTDNNIKEVERAINCSKKPVSIVLSANKGFTKIPDNFLYISEWDTTYILKNILLPSNLKSIGSCAFAHCYGLQYVLFQGKESSLESMGEYAFAHCGNLRYLELPANIKECDLSFVASCISLESITLPNWLTTVKDRMFKYHTNLTSIVIPESVTQIGIYAFEGCSSLTSISIPESVKYIGQGAFEGCTSLASITIPDSVTSINYCLFLGCTNLESVTLPKNLKAITYNAFEGCKLSKLDVPDNVNWGEYKYENGHLVSIKLPNGIQTIRGGAFQECSGLVSVSIPESVTDIKESAFWGCSSLESIIIPDGVKKISWELFAGCKSLKSVVIPISVTEIASGAFAGCKSLRTITIPESVTKIAEDAFNGCTGLTDVIIENKNFKFDVCYFLECSSIKSVMINGENAFAKCYKNDNGKIVENDKILPISVHIDNMSSDSTISKSNLVLLKEIGISTGNDEYDEYLKSHISMEIWAMVKGFVVSGTSKSTILNSDQIDVLNRVVIGSKVYVKIELERPEGIKKYIYVTLKVTE